MGRFFGALLVVLAYPLALINMITAPFRGRRERRTDMSEEVEERREKTRDELLDRNTNWLGYLMLAGIALAVAGALAYFVDATIGVVALGVFGIKLITGGGAA
jgi:hypothetical protein